MSVEIPLTLEKSHEEEKIQNIIPSIGYEIKEVQPFGVLIFGQIPIPDFVFFLKKFPKKSMIMTGISNYYKCNTAIAVSKELGEEWIEAIEKKLEEDYSDPTVRWINGTDVGRSSKTIYYAIKDGKKYSKGDVPQDPEDFGRCYRLLVKFPEWKDKFCVVSDINLGWKPFVENWNELSSLYEKEFPTGSAPKLYEKIKRLINESRKIEKEHVENAD